jgi:hypothetical protein
VTGLDGLWGSTIDEFTVSLALQTATIEITVPSQSGEASHHSLRFEGLSELRFVNRIPGPWSYVELTEIRTQPTANGRITAELLLWSEDARLRIEAGSAALDGVEL